MGTALLVDMTLLAVRLGRTIVSSADADPNTDKYVENSACAETFRQIV